MILVKLRNNISKIITNFQNGYRAYRASKKMETQLEGTKPKKKHSWENNIRQENRFMETF